MLAVEVVETRSLKPNQTVVRSIASFLRPVPEGGILDHDEYEGTSIEVVVDVICAAEAAGYRLVKREPEIGS